MFRFFTVRYNCTTLFALLFLLATVQGQTTSSYDGKTPSGLASGAPAGSYPLSGFDSINLYRICLQFKGKSFLLGEWHTQLI